MTISIFDLPSITELIPFSSKLSEVYQQIKSKTLPFTNSVSANILQRTIQSRLDKGLPFLPTQTESYTVNVIVPLDIDLSYIHKFALNEKKRQLFPFFTFKFLVPGYSFPEEPITRKVVFVISTDDAGYEKKITVNSKSRFHDVFKSHCNMFAFTIEDWFNVQLSSTVSSDKRSSKVVSTAFACFDPKSTKPALFGGSSPDGNLTLFFSCYNMNLTICSSKYSLATIRLDLPISDQSILEHRRYLSERKGEIAFVINSEYLKYLLNPKVGEPVLSFKNVHSLVYSKATELVRESDRRKFTLWIIKELPFSLFKSEPWVHDYSNLKHHFEWVNRGVRTIGLVANKASGKSSLINSITTNHYYIDSDLYGQVLTYISLLDDDRREIYKSKNVSNIVDDLVEKLIINEKNTLEFRETLQYESLFETLASHYITAKKVSFSSIASRNASRNTAVEKFLEVYNNATKLFPTSEYLHTITEVVARIAGLTFNSNTRIVVFAHTSHELKSILGGAVFRCCFCTDENITILLRDRDSSPIVQVFLQRFYESIEMSTFNAFPSAILSEYLSATD